MPQRTGQLTLCCNYLKGDAAFAVVVLNGRRELILAEMMGKYT